MLYDLGRLKSTVYILSTNQLSHVPQLTLNIYRVSLNYAHFVRTHFLVGFCLFKTHTVNYIDTGQIHEQQTVIRRTGRRDFEYYLEQVLYSRVMTENGSEKEMRRQRLWEW